MAGNRQKTWSRRQAAGDSRPCHADVLVEIATPDDSRAHRPPIGRLLGRVSRSHSRDAGAVFREIISQLVEFGLCTRTRQC